MELDTFIAPNLALDSLRSERGSMTPKEVYELALLATGDRVWAEREWARQVEFVQSQTKES